MIRGDDIPVTERKLSRQYKKYQALDIKELNCYEMGERIRRQRMAKSLTREYLADRIGISEAYVSDIEYGTKTTTIKNLYTIAKLLDLSVQYMLLGSQSTGISCDDADLMRIARNAASALSECTAREIKGMEHMVHAFADTLPAKYDFPTSNQPSYLCGVTSATGYLSAGKDLPVNAEDLTLDLQAMAERIKQRRLFLNFTRADIAEYLDVGEAYAADFEYGIKCMSLQKFHTLLHLLKTTADHLTGMQPTPIYFPDADSLASVANIGKIITSCPQKEAEYIFGMVRAYVDALYGA